MNIPVTIMHKTLVGFLMWLSTLITAVILGILLIALSVPATVLAILGGDISGLMTLTSVLALIGLLIIVFLAWVLNGYIFGFLVKVARMLKWLKGEI